MADEWEVISLRDAGIHLLDCDHKTPVAREAGRPYIAIPQLKAGRIDPTDARKISEDDFRQWTKKTCPQAWDVIVSRRCNPGETAFVPPGFEFALGQNLVILRSRGKRVYPPFLRWLLRSPAWREQVNTFINVGAVFDSLKCADIPNFQLPIPPLREQQAIAGILGALDDKIELNRRRNQTLEALARAIFQSWFVDFDPVKAKAAGRPPAGLTPALAALFPDRFIDSPLGPIPAGWSVGKLGEMVTLQRGFDLPATQRIAGDYPVMAASGENGTHNHYMAKGPGVTTGRSGVLGRVFFVHSDYWPLNTSLFVKHFSGCGPAYAFHLMERLDFGAFIPWPPPPEARSPARLG